MNMLRIFSITVMTIVFILLYGIIGYKILEPIFIPDPCYYDVHKIPTLINILFDFPSYEGYHPVPSKWGFILFGIIGGISGSKLAEIYTKKAILKNSHEQ